MSKAKRLFKTPTLEYYEDKHSISTIAHEEELHLDMFSHLSKKYRALFHRERLDVYPELVDAALMKEFCIELLNPEVVTRLMDTELGQGVIIGFLWASSDWKYVTEELADA